jgi:hypothetical protein
MPTQAKPTELSLLLKSVVEFKDMPNLPARTPFDVKVLRFLASLSESLRNCFEAKKFQDILTFSFFIRTSQLARFAGQYADLRDTSLGRGVTFHIAPSNVPIMFAYTLVAGLLSGNSCIVRVSENPFPQVRIICEELRKLLDQPEHNALARYICIVRYGHDLGWNSFFSSLCDVRLIWGGDRTISEIRRASLPAKSYEMLFPDRYSISVIRAEAYLETCDKVRVADGFYNDTYLYDQGACSSPRLIYWVGDTEYVSAAQKQFWDHLYRTLDGRNYRNEPLVTVGKYMTLCRAAINTPGVRRINTPDNRLMRIELDAVNVALQNYNCIGGVYFEYSGRGLDPIISLIQRKLQTLTCLGYDPVDLRDFLMRNGVNGVDRIVTIGEAGKFSLIWDGYDLIRHMSRRIVTQ